MRFALPMLCLAAACGGGADNPAPADTPPGTAAQAASGVNPAAMSPADRATKACSLVTQAEAEAILGKTPAAPEPQSGGTCYYAGGDLMLNLQTISLPSASEFKSFVESQVNSVNERSGMKAMAAEEVTGVGEAAMYDGMALHVYKNHFILTIVADKDKAIAVGKAAVVRWN